MQLFLTKKCHKITYFNAMKHKLIYLLLLIFTFSPLKTQIIYQESFETDFGNWNQLAYPTDDFDWTRHSGATPSPGTGPSAASDGTYYLYIEATGNHDPGKTAIIESSTFDFSSVQMPVFSFDYHMWGQGIGVLRLLAYDGYDWQEVWNNFVNLGNQWNNAKICLNDYANTANVKFRFVASTFFSDSSDIAIDNIKISNLNISSVTHTDVTCGGYGDGSLTINVNGGFSPYQYSIDDGVTYTNAVVSNNYTFNDLNGADYVVRVKDGSGCWIAYTNVITIIEPPIPDVDIFINNVSPCSYSHNGSITITASGSNQPFEYSITGTTGPFYTSNTFTNLDTGSYQIAVKNSLGCIANYGIGNITAPFDIYILELQVENVSGCSGNCNGNIRVIAGGGTAPLQFAINEDNNYQAGSYFSSLCTGTYRFFVKDNNGCVDTSDFVNITEPTPIIISDVSTTNISGCYGNTNGSISITAYGGTDSLFYSIDNGFNYFKENTFTGLSAGNYKIWVRDKNFCKTYYGEVTLTQPDLIQITNVTALDVLTCTGDNTGEIIIEATGGTGTFYYSIDNGQTFQDSAHFVGLAAGTYYPFVKDQNDCSATYMKVTISQPTELAIVDIVKYDVTTCYGGNNGIISIYATQGTPPYQYSIDGGNNFQTNLFFTGLTAGVYNIVVKDSVNCTVIGNQITINQPTQIEITSQTYSDVICYGQSDGTITINAQNGTGSLFYSTDDGVNFPYSIGTTTYKKAGTYIIVVKDQNNCKVWGDTIVISQPDSLYIDSITVVNAEGCYGAENGSITIHGIGGVKPYQYSIENGSNLQLDSVFSNLPAYAGYLPVLIDQNNCIAYFWPLTITQPQNLLYLSQTVKNIDTCNGVNVGKIIINAIGGTGTLQYSIDSGQTFVNNGGVFENLYAGNYHTQVKDSNNCIVDGVDVTIYEPPVMIIDSVIVTDVVCNSQSNGTIKIYARGGQPQLMYSINGGLTFSNSNFFPNLVAANYDIVVKDNFKCYQYSNTQINQPTLLVLDTILRTDVNTCYGEATGSITVNAHGGVSPLLYSYTKIGIYTSPYQQSNIFNNISAGPYFVNIKDQNGCSYTSYSFYIFEPEIVKIEKDTFSNITCFGANDGFIKITATGGVGNYQYSIDNGTNWSIDSVFTNLSEGNYYLRVKDQNNCLNIQPKFVNIIEPAQLKIYQVQSFSPTCNGNTDGQIRVYASGGTIPLTYTLNSSIYSTTGIFSNLDSGQYAIKVWDKNNCSVQYPNTITLIMPQKISIFDVNVDYGCSPLTVSFTPQNAPVSSAFAWEFGDGFFSNSFAPNHTFYNQTQNNQTFTVKASAVSSNCIDSSFATITVLSQPILDFDLDSIMHTFPDTFVTVNPLTTQYQNYHWNFGDGTTYSGLFPPIHSYSNCGTYKITFSASTLEGCVDSIEKNVLFNALPPVAAFEADKYNGCEPLNIRFKSLSYNTIAQRWFNGNDLISEDTAFSYTFDNANTYLLKLQAIGYCNLSNTTAFDITVHPSPQASFQVLTDTIGLYNGAKFTNTSIGASNYIWFFGDSTISQLQNPEAHIYNYAGLYDVSLVAISRYGCRDTFTINEAVLVSDDFKFVMPTGFSPDGDGINDFAIPYGNMVSECRIEIFNRHSQIIFRTDKWNSEFWDGTIRGRRLPIDVYYWKAYIKWSDGSYSHLNGTITLLR